MRTSWQMTSGRLGLSRLAQALGLRAGLVAGLVGVGGGVGGCTGQIPDAFRLSQQQDDFSTSQFQSINTKLDMLWVIDNSGSMNVSQERIRDGFESFARRYMKPNWDIRVAVIPTDAYIANAAFNNYRGLYVLSPGSSFRSSYLRQITANGVPGRGTPFVNPSFAPNLFDVNPASGNYGRAPSGIRVDQEWPGYAANYARLLPGIADGPMQRLCWEGRTSGVGTYISASGTSQCYIRDNQAAGATSCAQPGAGQTSQSQCVNTTMNNTVRSGKPIISTQPPAGTPADEVWTQQLVNDFLVNLSPGFWGSGSERGLGSILQLLQDNEGTSSRFFRPDSLRVIVLVGDEDDQTMTYPSSIPADFQPGTNYIGSCSKTIDGQSVTIANCPEAARLVPVSTIKSQIDTFFRSLDGTAPTASPNYFVSSIVATTYNSVMDLRAQRGTNEIDRADRFIELGQLVGNGSLTVDINSADYTALLDAIGQVIVSKKAAFQLSRVPGALEELVVFLVRENGTRVQIAPSQFSVAGQTLTITDQNLVLSFQSTDRISINYQPISL